MNRGIATAVGVTAVIVIVLGFVALAAIDDGDLGAPSATPTTADISPSPERTFPPGVGESPIVGESPTEVSPDGSPTQPGTATTQPPGTTASPSPGTEPAPSETTPPSPDVAMTGPVVPQSALWVGLVPLLMGALAARSLRRAPGKY